MAVKFSASSAYEGAEKAHDQDIHDQPADNVRRHIHVF